MPSVMTTSSSIPASIASMMASLANFGGTKMIDTVAPVFSMASTTVPKTGNSMSSPLASLCATLVPALRALTPPRICVPAFSIRAVCAVASLPVMPCTMTFESLVRKIAIGAPLSLRSPRLGARQLGGLVRGFVHRGNQCHQRVVRFGQDPSALFDVVAVEPDNQRLVGLLA